MRHVSHSQALALVSDPSSGFELVNDKVVAISYQKSRDDSPSCLTASDMKLNAGLHGDPMPIDRRRDGYIDPIEAARDKVAAWPTVGDVKREVFSGIFCPWPRMHTSFSNVDDTERLQLEHEIDPSLREAYLVKLGLYNTFN